MTPRKSPFSSGHDPWHGFGRGGTPENFLVLAAEELPPDGAQATEGVWGLVTHGGEPMAFVSPEVVQGLPADHPVAAVFDSLGSAYAAPLAAAPAVFFQRHLRRPVRGRVFILDHRWARQSGGRMMTAFGDPECDIGQILPVGEICGDECACDRRHQR